MHSQIIVIINIMNNAVVNIPNQQPPSLRSAIKSELLKADDSDGASQTSIGESASVPL